MAIEETPKNITPDKRLGINLAVNSLKKRFPFIMGYKDDDTSNNYISSHYINLDIDLHKLAHYMGVEVKPFWIDYIKNNPNDRKSYCIYSFLTFPGYDGTEVNLVNHPGYILTQQIYDYLELSYEFIPDEYKLFYQFESEYSPGKINDYPVRLKINNYYMNI